MTNQAPRITVGTRVVGTPEQRPVKIYHADLNFGSLIRLSSSCISSPPLLEITPTKLLRVVEILKTTYPLTSKRKVANNDLDESYNTNIEETNCDF